MTTFYQNSAILIMLSLLGGGIRIVLGPTHADRVLALQFFGTSGVAILLLLAKGTTWAALRDLALVLVCLAAVTTLAFIQLNSTPKRPDE